jgi:hypothetical protein
MRKKRQSPASISLPPRLPQNPAELERAITLLGNRKQTDLNAQARSKLVELLGVYPTVAEASFWKRVLRRVCQNGELPPPGFTALLDE